MLKKCEFCRDEFKAYHPKTQRACKKKECKIKMQAESKRMTNRRSKARNYAYYY